MSTHHWCSSSGRINLILSTEQVISASHQGSCDEDVLALSKEPLIEAQLEDIDPEALKRELREWGAWDDMELADHEANLQRVLWLACGDIADREL